MTQNFYNLLNLIFCATGIFTCFFAWSILQERIMTKPYETTTGFIQFDAPIILLCIQSFIATILSAIAIYSSKTVSKENTNYIGDKKTISNGFIPPSGTFKLLCIISFFLFIGPQFGFIAMKYLSYPLLTTVKLCKLIPILLIGLIWYKHRYPMNKIFTVLILTVGIMSLVLLDSNKSTVKDKSSSMFGVVLCLLNMICDGFSGSTQEVLSKKYKLSSFQLMFFCNVGLFCVSTSIILFHEFGIFGLNYLQIILPENSILFPILNYFSLLLSSKPSEINHIMIFINSNIHAIIHIFCLGFVNSLGQFFIFRCISSFDVLTTTGITLTRKVGTILISIFNNNHKLSIQQWGSLSLVFIGVIVDSHYSIKSKRMK